MLIENHFFVPAEPGRVWDLLADLGSVATCLPGARVDSFEEDTLTGAVAVRIGPMNLTYGGRARFVVLDDEGMVATIEGSGKDRRGGGTVAARIKISLSEAGGGTQVQLSTDLGLTGRVAQLGQGPITDVSAALLGQFADCLVTRIETPSGTPTGAPATDDGQRAAVITREPVNLLSGSTFSAQTITLGVAAVAGVVVSAAALWAAQRWLRARNLRRRRS